MLVLFGIVAVVAPPASSSASRGDWRARGAGARATAPQRAVLAPAPESNASGDFQYRGCAFCGSGARRARGERAEAAPRAARAGKSNIYIEHNRKIRNRLNYIKSLAGRRYYLYPSAPQGPRLGAGAWHGASGQGARPTRGSGEAARNNVVMSAGERTSCPGLICYLLSICRCYLRDSFSVQELCGRAARGRPLLPATKAPTQTASSRNACNRAAHVSRAAPAAPRRRAQS